MMQTLTAWCALVEAGRSVNLSGLEARVSWLCARLLELNRADASAMQGELGALLGRVDALTAALRQAAGGAG